MIISMEVRKIIHVDMDAFFASVEQRNNPELRGKPVIVGGSPRSRGVVAACSYEARKYGIHSAMASSIAHRLCPHAIFIQGNFDEYNDVSEQIGEIFHEYTDLVEPLSLDEAYLDVTDNLQGTTYATQIAREIRRRILEKTRLTASAGVSYNKFLAKVASDYNKPDGMTVITPDMAGDFIEALPIGKFHGIGKVTEKRMQELGIKTGYDLKRISRDSLKSMFGKVGDYYYDISHGIDDRPVEPDYIRKSIGKEVTLQEDISDRMLMHEVLDSLAGRVSRALEKHGSKGRTITLKVKYADFQSISRSVSLVEYMDRKELLLDNAKMLLEKTEAGDRKVRLLGISVSNLDSEEDRYEDVQLILPFAV